LVSCFIRKEYHQIKISLNNKNVVSFERYYYAYTHRKNNFAKESKNLVRYRSKIIFVIDYQNNYVA